MAQSKQNTSLKKSSKQQNQQKHKKYLGLAAIFFRQFAHAAHTRFVPLLSLFLRGDASGCKLRQKRRVNLGQLYSELSLYWTIVMLHNRESFSSLCPVLVVSLGSPF